MGWENVKKTAQGEMTLNGFDHALLDMTREYTQEQNAQFLENAKIFDNSLSIRAGSESLF